MSTLQKFEVSEEVAFAAWNNLAIALYRGPLSPSTVRGINELCKYLGKQFPDGIALLTIVPEGVPLPDDKVRAEISTTMAEIEPFMRCMCSIHESPGVKGAAVRSMTRAVALMSRASYKMATFDSVKPAAEVLAPFIHPAASTAQIEVAVSQFRLRVAESQLNRHRPQT